MRESEVGLKGEENNNVKANTTRIKQVEQPQNVQSAW
jgi:hypothetical protein